MELFRNLFEGYPNLWGGGVAHSVLVFRSVEQPKTTRNTQA